MHQRIFEELARQRQADFQRLAAGRRRVSAGAGHVRHARDAAQSLRARTGWWLVDLGLKLIVRPASRRAASPRPAGS